jgi:hypothetical protein
MKRLSLVILVAALVATWPGLSATAASAAVWSPPQNVSSPVLFVDDPAIGFSGDGRALASWRWQTGVGNAARFGHRSATRAPGASAFEPELTAPDFAAGPVLYGRSRAVAAVLTSAGGKPARPRLRLAATFGDASGRFGRGVRVRTALRISRPVIAAAQNGRAALAWFEDRGTSNDRVYVSLRRPGGRFGRPLLLSRSRIRSVSVAVGEDGDVLVAWDARGVVRTAFKAAGRRSFRIQTIRSEKTFFAKLQTVIGPAGRAVVAWGAQLLTEGGGTGPVFYQAAVKPAGVRRFRDAQLLERGTELQRAGPVSLVSDTAGHQLFAWSGFDGSNYRIRVSTTDRRAVFGQPEQVSVAGLDAQDPSLAAGPGGDALVTWKQALSGVTDDEAGQVFASHRPPEGSFGAPEIVSLPERAAFPSAAFDPVGGRPTVVWSNRPGLSGPGVPFAEITTFLQASTRS